MRKIPQAVAMVLLVSALHGQQAQQSSNAQPEIASALKNFLAHVEDPATHEQWWAEELVYTGSSGAMRSKAEIMKSVREGAAQPKDSKAPASTFDAEDIKVTPYGDIAVLTFRLVSREGDKTNYFRNSGVLIKRNGRWQVVAWQATKAPDYKPDGEVKSTKQ